MYSIPNFICHEKSFGIEHFKTFFIWLLYDFQLGYLELLFQVKFMLF